MKRYQGVIFDLDGTLLDTLDDLTDSINFILQQYGLPSCSKIQTASYLGYGSQVYLEKASGGKLNPEQFAECLDTYKTYYAAHMNQKTKPFSEILPLLESLQQAGIYTAVVSNKFDAAVKGLCQQYFGNRIDFAIGEGHGLRPKPNGDMLQAVAKKWGIALQDCIYIGDTEVDLQTAKNANMPCIAVSWGFRTKNQLLDFGANCIVDTPEELKNILLGKDRL